MKNRPIGVTITGLFLILNSCFSVGMVVVSYIQLVSNESEALYFNPGTEFIFKILYIILAVLCLLWIPLGVGLFRLNQMARNATIGYSVLWLFGTFIVLINGKGSIFLAVLNVWSGAVLWYLLRSSVKMQFQVKKQGK